MLSLAVRRAVLRVKDHRFEGLPRDHPEASSATPLRPGVVVIDGNDVDVGPNRVTPDNVAVVVETAAYKMGEIGARVAARCKCRLPRDVLPESDEIERR